MAFYFTADMSRQDFEDAIAEAKAEGKAEGIKAGGAKLAAITSRYAAISASEKLSSDAALMSAALKLASTTDLPGDDIVAFVVENVQPTATFTPSTSPASLANRLTFESSDPLAFGGGFLPPAAADGWQEAVGQAAGKTEPKT